MKRAIVTSLLLLAASSAAIAAELEAELDGYLAEFEVARLAEAPSSNTLGSHFATDKDSGAGKEIERDWHAIVELYFFIPLSASGDVSFPNSPISSASAQRSPAQSGGTDLIEIDSLSGYVIPFRSMWIKGKWGILFEVTYADLDLDGTLNGIVGNSFDLGFKFWFFDLSLAYQFVQQNPGHQPWLVNVFVGARVSQYDLSLSIGSAGASKRSETFIEPLIGTYIGFAFNESWSLLMRIDASGFGASGHDELTYNFELGVVWKWGKRKEWLLDLGWRYAAITYENGSGNSRRKVDVTLHGPFIAIGYAF